MDKKAHELLEKLYKHLTPQQIDALKQYTTQTKIVYGEMFAIRNREPLGDRPENQDLVVPLQVQMLRILETASQKLDRIAAQHDQTHAAVEDMKTDAKKGGKFRDAIASGVGQFLAEWKAKK